MKKKRWQMISSGIACLLSILFLFKLGMTGDEIKPGDTIGPDNWEKIKGYVPEAIIKAVKEGYQFKVGGEKLIPAPASFLELSKKGTTTLTANGWIENYKGGFPFYPFNPKDKDAAVKLAWNMYRRPYDDITYGKVNGMYRTNSPDDYDVGRRICINKYGEELITDTQSWEMKTNHRTFIDPKPNIKGFDHIEFFRANLVVTPRDLAGTLAMEVRYWDPKKGDDFFLYIPSLRRVRRLPTSTRSSTRAPADYTWDDVRGFSGKIPHFNWKILGEKKGLFSYMDKIPTPHDKGKFVSNYEKFIIEDVYLLEHTPKDTAYKIPRRVYWIGKNTLLPYYWWMYDKKGELWRTFAMPLIRMYTHDKKDFFDYCCGLWIEDVQIQHGTIIECNNEINSGIETGFFSLSKLLTMTRGMR